jgi:hypothetical protein
MDGPPPRPEVAVRVPGGRAAAAVLFDVPRRRGGA